MDFDEDSSLVIVENEKSVAIQAKSAYHDFNNDVSLGSAEKDLEEQLTLPVNGLTLVESNPKSPSAKKLIIDFT